MCSDLVLECCSSHSYSDLKTVFLMFVMLACYNFYEFDHEQTLQQCSQAQFVKLIAACVKKALQNQSSPVSKD